MDRLSPQDSLFLHVEDGITHMHIASCAIFERPPPAYEDVVSLIASKLPRLPRYRQKVRFAPANLGQPVWVDDPHFNLAYHVRHSALPPPGREQELNDLMGRLMAVELDRHRPLWEVWMIEGLTGGRWALISKVHHCMVDGVSGTDLMVQLLDASPDATTPPTEAWTPAPEPSTARLAFEGMADALDHSARRARPPRVSRRRRPRESYSALRSIANGAIALTRELQPAPMLSIGGAIGPHRRWATARADLDELKAIRRTFGGTVNDVVLAAIAGAFRDLLLARGDPVDGATVRTLVPVSVRAAGDHTANNQVSAIIARLEVGVADPVERLDATRQQMERPEGLPRSGRRRVPLDAGRIHTANDPGARPPVRHAWLRRVPANTVNTVTTNVPGPQYPLYALGREMVEYLPYVPLSQGVRLGVAILSYNGLVRFGITGDYDTMPEVDWFCRRIEAGIAELTERAANAAVPSPAG